MPTVGGGPVGPVGESYETVGGCYPWRAPNRSSLAEGSSSIGRAPVSKTGGWGFESLLPCSSALNPPNKTPTTREDLL